MKTCSKRRETKPVDRFYKTSKAKDGLYYYCKDCASKDTSKWYSKNKAAYAEKRSLLRKENVEAARSKASEYRSANKERIAEYDKQWRRRNRPKVAKKSSDVRARRSTPAWANKLAILREYELAAWCTKVTGEAYNVDHIVPLRSKIVCGLHCEANLQVITAAENFRKSNQRWPDMPA